MDHHYVPKDVESELDSSFFERGEREKQVRKKEGQRRFQRSEGNVTLITPYFSLLNFTP